MRSEDVIGLEAQDAPQISAKTGLNVDQVLEQIVNKVPAPAGDVDAPLKALIFDSVYDPYKGCYRILQSEGRTCEKGTRIHMMATGFHHGGCGGWIFLERVSLSHVTS